MSDCSSVIIFLQFDGNLVKIGLVDPEIIGLTEEPLKIKKVTEAKPCDCVNR